MKDPSGRAEKIWKTATKKAAGAWRNRPALARVLHSLYKRCISPFFGNVCRFEPSCSDYALTACQRHGAFKGLLLTLGRVLRCNPWCRGGYDPVPEKEERPKKVLRKITQ